MPELSQNIGKKKLKSQYKILAKYIMALVNQAAENVPLIGYHMVLYR